MGRASFAFVGGFLIVNSYLLSWLFPNEVFAADLSAAIGAVTLALPIVVTAAAVMIMIVVVVVVMMLVIVVVVVVMMTARANVSGFHSRILHFQFVSHYFFSSAAPPPAPAGAVGARCCRGS